MSNIVLSLRRECLRCGDVTAKNVRRIMLKSGSSKSLIFYILCDECVGATSEEIHFSLERYPLRWQASGIRGLQTDNPILTDPNYIKFRIGR